jgi:anti-sigma regulatory factor (Ser/Thr protein kinase)
VIAAEFGVSRAAVAPVLRRLEREGFLRRSAPGTRPSFEPGPSRLVHERVSLPGIDESALWEQRFAPLLGLSGNVANIAHYVFTEMVNNANDHADGTQLNVRVMQTIDTLYLVVADDGVGAFRRIARSLGLEDERLAVLELVKGKFTTDPARHTGEGVFFASRAADAFCCGRTASSTGVTSRARWPGGP